MTIILGIDPGSRITGYGVIEVKDKQIAYLDSGCIKALEGSLSHRLLGIFNGICQLMDEYAPEEVAIEQIFTLANNPSSALKLGHARGVAMVAAASHRVEVNEYSAREVKLAIVGYGAAKKIQVQHMVKQLLSLTAMPQSDAADALAIAICHSHMRNQQFVSRPAARRRNKRRSHV